MSPITTAAADGEQAVPAEHLVTLDDKVAFLRQPQAYGKTPRQVEARETHMSWVFLTERHAFKLKKPIRFPHLDFSTLALRRRFCEAELVLNRRLAAAVYLGLSRLGREASGRLSLDGEGESVDWLVRMVRLPGERKLERMIGRGQFDEAGVTAAAALLSRFYQQAVPVGMASHTYLKHLREEISAIAAELLSPQFALPRNRIEAIAAALQAFVDRRTRLLADRAARVLDAHGDLRPQHVYLGHEPAIIDCLEFDRDLRMRDPLDEVAFLRLECERLGDRRPGDVFVDVYARISGDPVPGDLIGFYGAFRALERAKLAIGHLRDATGDADKWRNRTLTYLTLARDQVCEAPRQSH